MGILSSQQDFNKLKILLAHQLVLQSTKLLIANFYDNEQQFMSKSLLFVSKCADLFHLYNHKNILFMHAFDGSVMRERVETLNVTTQEFQRLEENDFDFPMWKLINSNRSTLDIAYIDNPPFSKIENGKVVGIDGTILDEFCKLYGLNYRIKNKANNFANFKALLPRVDLTLYTKIVWNYKLVENIWLNEFDGICLMMPRNVQVEAYKNLSFPFDTKVALLLFFTVVIIGFFWGILKKIQEERVSKLKIAFNMYQSLIGLSMQNSTWSRKEILLIFPFLFMQIILIGAYQSWIISFMISKPSMRSIESVAELNSSNQRVFRYFHETKVKINPKLIMNLGSVASDALTFTLPDNFDRTLVYQVSCQYANYFVKSSHNFDGNQERIYDVLNTPVASNLQTYIANEGFALKNEFRSVVETLKESGIYDYWMKLASEEIFKQKTLEDEAKSFIDIADMVFPFQTLLFGAVVALFVLAFEIVGIKLIEFGTNLWRYNRSRRVRPFVL
jgi:hypothetical protein